MNLKEKTINAVCFAFGCLIVASTYVLTYRVGKFVGAYNMIVHLNNEFDTDNKEDMN